MELKSVQRTGSCLCGGVQFEIHGEMSAVVACHCSQCAKTSGNFMASTSCSDEQLKIVSEKTLRWFASSDNVQRGFCSRCGGNIFWRKLGSGEIFITAGTLDTPTGLKIGEHIFVAAKSDYYDITDGLPQKDER